MVLPAYIFSLITRNPTGARSRVKGHRAEFVPGRLFLNEPGEPAFGEEGRGAADVLVVAPEALVEAAP